MTGKTYRIRPLVWVNVMPHRLRATVSDGEYVDLYIYEYSDGTWGVEAYDEHIGPAATLDEAKVAAESFYRERLTEALEEVK